MIDESKPASCSSAGTEAARALPAAACSAGEVEGGLFLGSESPSSGGAGKWFVVSGIFYIGPFSFEPPEVKVWNRQRWLGTASWGLCLFLPAVYLRRAAIYTAGRKHNSQPLRV